MHALRYCGGDESFAHHQLQAAMLEAGFLNLINSLVSPSAKACLGTVVNAARHATRMVFRGPKAHLNTRISHSGFKAQFEGGTRNHALWHPYACVVF